MRAGPYQRSGELLYARFAYVTAIYPFATISPSSLSR